MSINAHCSLISSLPVEINMSPIPISCSAPFASIIVLESVVDVTLKATLAGKLALINPVITFTEGL